MSILVYAGAADAALLGSYTNYYLVRKVQLLEDLYDDQIGSWEDLKATAAAAAYDITNIETIYLPDGSDGDVGEASTSRNSFFAYSLLYCR